MAKRCEICGKGPVVGRTISHAHNVGPRRFEPNLQSVKAVVDGARQAISAPNAAKPIGPYSPAIRAGNLLFISGQVGFDPATGALVDGDVVAQTNQVMRNISSLLQAAGLGFEHVVRTTVYLADMNEFAKMNEVYGRYVVDPPPARSTVQVARLPRDARVEIDVIAVFG